MSMLQNVNNTTLLAIFLLPFVLVIVLNKKYLVIAGIGAAMTAIGIGIFAKTKKKRNTVGIGKPNFFPLFLSASIRGEFFW